MLSKYGKQYSGNNCPLGWIIVIQLKLIMARLLQALPLDRDSSNLTIWEGWSFLTWLALCAATLMSTQSIEVTSSPHSLDTNRCLHHIVMSQPSTLNNSVLLTVVAVKRWSTVWSQLTEMTQVCLNCFFAIHCRVESLTESSLCRCSSPGSEGAMNIDRRSP